MTILSAIIGNIASTISSKLISKESDSREKSMVEISATDCGAVTGGPQVENDTQI